MSVHIAQVIADAIYLFARMEPTRHPLDPEKSNRALGFPALIIGLCQSYGVPVTPSKVIRPSITRAFIEKYCTPRQAQGDTHQATHINRRHLGRPIRMGHWAWSGIYSIWFTSRRPTTVDRCIYMSVSTGSSYFFCD